MDRRCFLKSLAAAAATPEARRLGQGDISDVRFIGRAEAQSAPDLDLAAMARYALHHLRNNPRPNLAYECRFSMSLLKYPPCPGPNDHDAITIGDTDNRFDWEYGYMKEMCPDSWDETLDGMARGVRKRVLGYLRADGLCWTTQASGSRIPGTWASSWTTGKLLISLSEDFRRTADKALRPLCRKMFEALRARAVRMNGRAYYAGGNSFWNERGWAISDASPYHPAMVLESVTAYYEAFRDDDALDFAVAFAQGEMANDQWEHWVLKHHDNLTAEQEAQRNLTSSIAVWPTAPPSADLSVRPDGSFDHHSHMRGHLGWGMAHLAAVTGEAKLTAWSKRLLDFFLSNGTDFGWIPESMTYPRRSETCAVSDVINMAEWMAKAGYPEYWDVLERFVRNYIREAQFFLSPEYERLYGKLHPGRNGAEGLKIAAMLQGGFQGAMGVCDRVWTGDDMDMMGCCVPEGMRALHTAWKNTVTSAAGGVHVNMSFNRDGREARVTSALPFAGRLTVRVKAPHDFFLRPPTWAPRDLVRALRNGRAVSAVWKGAYVCLPRARAGEELTLEYPLASFTQRQTVRNAPKEPDRKIVVSWLGNTVLKLEPHGAKLPLYEQVPRPLPRSFPKRY